MIEPRIKIPKITNEARQRIRNNSVAKLPANASESGLSAIALQELFVAPIIGEQNSIITEYNAAIGEVNIVLNAFDGVVSKSSEDSAKAITDSCAALVAASNAEESALKSAKDSAAAGLAAKQAEDNSIAADTNSKAALENSITAKQNAKTALDTANGIDAKATTALGNSTAALDKSVTAENTANTVRSEFDQIVEGKIGISQDILSTDPLTAPSSEAVRNALDDLTQVITPISQQSQVVHLEGTSAGFVDELIMSSEPTQVVSPNLIKQPYIQSSLTTQGITFTVNADFSIKVSGMPTNFATFHLCQLTLPIGTYCSSGTVYNGVSIIYQNVEPQSGEPPYLNFSAITLTRATLINIYLQVNPTYTPNNVSVYPMLNVGSTALPYQPYTGQPSPDNPIPINVVSSPVNIVSCEANLLPNTLQTKTQSGVMFTVNADKSITVNGTATARIVLYITEPKHQPFYFAKGTNFVLSTKELSQSGVAFEILVTSTENKYSYFAVGDYRYVHGFTLPNNGKTIGSYIVIDSGITVDNYTFYPMLNIGTNDLPYEPYNAVTTPIPLETVATETTPSKPVELLGVYNTKTNILVQNYKKIVLDGTEKWIKGGRGDGTNPNLSRFVFYYSNIKKAQSFCNLLKHYNPSAFYANSEGIYVSDSASSQFDILVNNTRLSTPDAIGFKAWLQTNPLTVYYELATPEILTLNPTPHIPTLAGTTNIYTVNNASPVTFNITELLDGGNQTNVVLKDKDDNVLNPRTVAEQVRINDDGETLDRELERIQAAISGVDSDLSAEISARTAVDTQISGDVQTIASNLSKETTARETADTAMRDELTSGELVAKNATKAVVAENGITKQDGLDYSYPKYYPYNNEQTNSKILVPHGFLAPSEYFSLDSPTSNTARLNINYLDYAANTGNKKLAAGLYKITIDFSAIDNIGLDNHQIYTFIFQAEINLESSGLFYQSVCPILFTPETDSLHYKIDGVIFFRFYENGNLVIIIENKDRVALPSNLSSIKIKDITLLY